MILTLILGDRLESDFRRSLVLSGGSPSILVERPVSLVLLLVAVALTWFSLTRWTRREEVVAAAEPD
jgi:putative tricarboxylic transport membrane protein